MIPQKTKMNGRNIAIIDNQENNDSYGICVKSLGYFSKKNDINNSLKCTTLNSKNSIKKQLNKNKKYSINILYITANNDNIEVSDNEPIKKIVKVIGIGKAINNLFGTNA